jgi:hypothetical protein
MTRLMEFQAAAVCGGGVLLEQDPGAVVVQAPPAGVRADDTERGAGAGTGLRLARNSGPLACGPVGQAQQPAQQVRGAGVPVDELDVTNLGPDNRTALFEVEIIDVEREVVPWWRCCSPCAARRWAAACEAGHRFLWAHQVGQDMRPARKGRTPASGLVWRRRSMASRRSSTPPMCAAMTERRGLEDSVARLETHMRWSGV